MRSACSDLGPGDGLDPRLDNKEAPPKVRNRKALQLCAQVAETLSFVLAGECDDDLLRELRVESVVPAPTSARMLVTLSIAGLGTEISREKVTQRLESVRGQLRSEVATAISRRKVPDLLFNLIRRDGK
jgi:ribosome-binding factor A